MKKAICLLVCVMNVWLASAQKKWVEDGNVELRAINGPFNAIRVSGGIQLFLSQSDEEKVAVSASDSRLVQGIKAIVEGKTLRIFYDGEKNVYRKGRNITVYVSFRNLEMIEGSGATDLRAEDVIRVQDLSIRLSGASDFNGSVEVKNLSLDMSGASDIRIAGQSSSLLITGSGASDIKGYGLVTDYCEARASGASDIQVTVNKEIKANASGASSIHYKGGAVMTDIHTSGASSVARKDD